MSFGRYPVDNSEHFFDLMQQLQVASSDAPIVPGESEIAACSVSIDPDGEKAKPVLRPISSQARFFGAAATGVVLEPIFQPMDTVVKRLQNNQGKIHVPDQPLSVTMDNLNKVVFRHASGESIILKIASLYQAIGVAMVYSAFQRAYKFGGQPVVARCMDNYFGERMREKFGDQSSKTMVESLAGVTVGAGEALLLLPLDTIKVKLQLGAINYQNSNAGRFQQARAIMNVVRTEKFSLYNGLEATMARNVSGSFALFGLSAFVQHNLFHLENARDATTFQSVVSSAVGALGTVIVTNPLDVLKVRSQAVDGQGKHVNVFKLWKKIASEEGARAFYKGVAPRAVVVVPKLTAVKTVADLLSCSFDRLFSRRSEQKQLDELRSVNRPPSSSAPKV